MVSEHMGGGALCSTGSSLPSSYHTRISSSSGCSFYNNKPGGASDETYLLMQRCKDMGSSWVRKDLWGRYCSQVPVSNLLESCEGLVGYSHRGLQKSQSYNDELLFIASSDLKSEIFLWVLLSPLAELITP